MFDVIADVISAMEYKETETNVNGGTCVSPRLGVAVFMIKNFIADERSATRAKYIDSNVRGDKWSNIDKHSIPVKMQKQKEE